MAAYHEAMTRFVTCALAIGLATTVMACGRTGPESNALDVTWQIAPAAPVVGRESAADVTLRLSNGGAVVGARLNLEGHMSHPGMAPVIARLAEAGDGRYHTRLTLTMAGDWVMFIDGQLADGRVVRQRVAEVAASPAE
jgi:hypothetical protein